MVGRRTNAQIKIDQQVGKRLKALRKVNGFTQEKLAGRCNITFQQIQKYEKGTNRISASRLCQFSHIFDVPVQDFFPDKYTQVTT